MKLCKKCGQEKPLDKFNRRGSKHQPYCRTCQADVHKEYYDNTPQRKVQIRARAAQQKALARDFILDYLSTHHCVDCGNSNRVVLEFDHVKPGKLHDIGLMVTQGYLLTAIEAEIAKCEVRCANCHKIVTAKRGGWYEWKK